MIQSLLLAALFFVGKFADSLSKILDVVGDGGTQLLGNLAELLSVLFELDELRTKLLDFVGAATGRRHAQQFLIVDGEITIRSSLY